MPKANSTARITSCGATTNATLVKAGPGDIHTVVATNTTATVKYLKIYNKASAPTVGTDVPVLTVALAPNNALTFFDLPQGLYCNLGIAFAITGANGDSDTTALTAGDVVGVNIIYS
jgi:hypothetical protein